jgi:ribose transport system substrate-binding protein
MKKLSIIVSLITDKNAYQKDQATAAKEAAQRLGVDVRVVFADSDAVTQSEQLLKAIQSPEGIRPDGIVCLPVGTTLERVAREAATRGIAWALVNREGDYLMELRNVHKTLTFMITVDQEEIGRIQGRQFGVLLPSGGTVLYILGPSTNPVFKLRLAGMQSTKPANIQVITMRGNLTEESGYQAISSWLRLHTSRTTRVDLVAGQNDDMAIGARRAFEDALSGDERERWSSLPYTGCDASSGAGGEWIRRGLLTASVFLPPTAGLALETLVKSIQGKTQPPLQQQIAPVSRPLLEKLAEVAGKKEAVPK